MPTFEFEIPVYSRKYINNKFINCSVNLYLLNYTSHNFNEARLEEYIWDDKPYKKYVKTIRSKVSDMKLICVVELTEEISIYTKLEIVDYVNGQCSDGWGEGFEQENVEYNHQIYNISTSKNKKPTCLDLFKESLNV